MPAFDVQILAKVEAVLDQDTHKFHPFVWFEVYGGWQENIVQRFGFRHPDEFDNYSEAQEFAKDNLKVTLNAIL